QPRGAARFAGRSPAAARLQARRQACGRAPRSRGEPAMSDAMVLSDPARRQIESWRGGAARIVFTNGVFDLLHRGHVEYLAEARALGNCLVVGINSDDSVRRLGKGDGRPLVPAADRAAVVGALRSVDLVVIFDDDTPEQLIREVRPDVLVK